jgi:hypothetical protein
MNILGGHIMAATAKLNPRITASAPKPVAIFEFCYVILLFNL